MKLRDLLANLKQLKSALTRIGSLSVAHPASSDHSRQWSDNGSTTDRQRLGYGSAKFHKNLCRAAAVLCLIVTIGVGDMWGANYEYIMITDPSEVTAGTYVVGALRSESATNNFYFGKATTSSGDWVVSDDYVNIEAVNGVRRFDASDLPSGAVEFTFTGNNTDGFNITNGTKYLYYTSNANRKLSFANSQSSYKWTVASKSSPLITGGVVFQKKTGGDATYYTISENATGTGAIRGYNSETKYRAIYLFKKKEKIEGNYVLVEQAGDIGPGEYLIVYNNTYALNTHYGNINNNTYGTYTNISSYYSSKKIASNSTTDALAYFIATTTNGYSIKRGEFLGNSSNNTGAYLRWDEAFTTSQNEWTLGVNSIVSARNSSYAIRWNNNSGQYRFAIYSPTGQNAVQLFKKVPASSCSLSGDIYVTSTNGRGIMAAEPLAVSASDLTPSTGTVTLTSNSGDVYFSADRNPNFAKASKPTTTLTLTADGSGDIDANVYVHYKPSSAGTGSASDVTVTATPSTGDPVTRTIHVRNMPSQFVIAAKAGNTWYALPADFSSSSTTPEAIVIDVNETTMTATAPNTCFYSLWPVKTTAGEYDRYATNTTHYEGNAYGEHVRLVTVNDHKGLWANNANSGAGIRNTTTIESLGGGPDPASETDDSYEWKIVTTVTDNKWHYTLQSNQSYQISKGRHLSLAVGSHAGSSFVWGTYDNSAFTNDLYFLPVTEKSPFTLKVVEWYPTKVLVYSTSDLTSLSPSVTIGGNAVASPTFTSKGTNLYEIGGLDLTNVSNATKTMTICYTASAVNYAASVKVPIIISRAVNSVSIANASGSGSPKPLNAPFSTLTYAIYNYADLVVRDGATLTVNGTEAQNTFYHVTIYPTSKISVPATNANGSTSKLCVHSLTFFGGIDEIYNGSSYTINKYGVPELSLKGNCGKKTVSTIDYVMRVDLSQMYALALPYDVDLADITYWDGAAMTPGTDLYLSAYNGQARANRESKAWVYEEEFEEKFGNATLSAGVGYTISAELQSGFGNTYSIIRLPMKHNFTRDNSEAAKTVAVTAYANTEGVAITDNHKGWNFVGNPYMVTISGSSAGGAGDSKLEIGYLEPTDTDPWDGNYNLRNDGYRYITFPSDDGIEYEQKKWADATLKPFKNFFIQVQTNGDLSFALASRADAPARFLQASEREIEFEITLSNETQLDHIGLLLAEKYTPAYEINADLEKMENTMSVYTLTADYKLAYNALSPNDAKQPIPVGYIANEAGSYTFSLDEKSNVEEIEHIWLTDYDLDRVVDLLDASYDFTAIQGRNETRFALTVELKAEDDTPTDVGEIIPPDKNDAPTKFIWHDKMYIQNQGIIYDATGKRVNVINK